MSRTTTQVDRLAKTLLTAIKKRLAELLAVNLFKLPSDRMKAGEIRAAVAAARDQILDLDFDGWLGRVPDRAERRAASRALARLEAEGLVKRLAWGPGGRDTTHVRLLEPAS